jgi:hypothetical protein
MISLLLLKVTALVNSIQPEIHLMRERGFLTIASYKGSDRFLINHLTPGYTAITVKREGDLLSVCFWTYLSEGKSTWSQEEFTMPKTNEEIADLASKIAWKFLDRSRITPNALQCLVLGVFNESD